MDLGPLRALALDLSFTAHGIDAVVTLPNEDPVDARIIWIANTPDQAPSSAGFSRQEPVRIVALRRSEVPIVPRGTRIVAPELGGGTDKAWVVDGSDRVDADHHRFIVVLDQVATADLPD